MVRGVLKLSVPPTQEEIVGVVLSLYAHGYLHTAEGVFRAYRDRIDIVVAERFEREMFNVRSDALVVAV